LRKHISSPQFFFPFMVFPFITNVDCGLCDYGWQPHTTIMCLWEDKHLFGCITFCIPTSTCQWCMLLHSTKLFSMLWLASFSCCTYLHFSLSGYCLLYVPIFGEQIPTYASNSCNAYICTCKKKCILIYRYLKLDVPF